MNYLLQTLNVYLAQRIGSSRRKHHREVICTDELNNLVIPYISGYERRMTNVVNSSQKPVEFMKFNRQKKKYIIDQSDKPLVPGNKAMIYHFKGARLNYIIRKKLAMPVQDYLKAAFEVESFNRMNAVRNIKVKKPKSLEEAIFSNIGDKK